ncbi:MAG TPA: cation transporter [Candidatus Dormibacteraeota bacterium]|jgi:divalent metal cation (Fe/Co/Zn/Cd) transporter|nr:cation transporter [Candidatus Dormibacteraeota bacterium]
MSTVISVPDSAYQQARLAQVLTVAWMVIEGVVAIGAGILASSVALTAFGFDSVIEIFSATVVLRQLVRSRTEPSDELRQGERRASRLVGIGLYGVAVYIVLSSAYTLLRGIHPDPSPLGLTLAVASLVIMPVLWRWRLALSRRIHSAALRADAACSAVCLYMAATLLVGLVLNRLFGWWWADPVAGLAMIWWIRNEANEALEAAATGKHCEEC